MSINLGVNIWSGVRGVGAFPGVSRDKLTANRDYYVRDDGSDSNNGRSNTAAGAWLTLQKAANFIGANIDFAGFRITVNVVPSSGSKSFAGVYNRNYVGGGQLYWKGDINTPSNTVLLNAVNPFFGFNQGSFNVLERTDTAIWVNGFRFDPTAGPALDADPASCGDQQITFGDLENFITANIEIAGNANGGGLILGNFFDAGNSIVVDGSELTSPNAFLNSLNNTAPFLGSTITIQDTPSFSGSWHIVNERCVLQDFATYSGSATGRRFDVGGAGASIIAASLTSMPGNSDGIVTVGGTFLYTGSDGVFLGSARTHEYVTNVTTTPTTLTNLNTGRIFTNTGAGARVDFNLPSAQADTKFTFMVRNVNGIRVVAAGGDTIEVGGVASAAGGRIDAAAIGDVITIRCINATEWITESAQGIWIPT